MSYHMGDMPEYATVTSTLASQPAKASRVRARARARRALSGVTSQARGPRISRIAMGDPAMYTAATPCSEIPSGDAYRAPGNQCLSNDKHTVMSFDATGNVYAPTPWSTYALVAGAALVAVHLLK